MNHHFSFPLSPAIAIAIALSLYEVLSGVFTGNRRLQTLSRRQEATEMAGVKRWAFSFATLLSGHRILPMATPSITPRALYGRRETIMCGTTRMMSNVPKESVYGGPKAQSPWERITLKRLNLMYLKGKPITMVTAYDYPSAVHLHEAGIDICLVGDSAAMVVHGHDTTLPITMEEMLVHCRAVARGAKMPFLVGDLPFGSYETSSGQAVESAVRMLKEGGMDAIKLEGGATSRIAAAKSIGEAGIAVMGHVGLTPQAISVLGGFRPQGRNVASALQVVETALALQDAGCFAVVLECVPSPVAAAATSVLKIPTIGIGAGPFCSGQVLVYHDLLGMLQHPHHGKVAPKFCRQYGQVGESINKALLQYREDVVNRSFPDAVHTPYRIDPNEVDAFLSELGKRGLGEAASAAAEAAEKDLKAGKPRIETPAD